MLLPTCRRRSSHLCRVRHCNIGHRQAHAFVAAAPRVSPRRATAPRRPPRIAAASTPGRTALSRGR
eukprot:932651-Prymnesium_polylepis.1